MRGLVFSIVEFGNDSLCGLSSRGHESLQNADLVLLDKDLPCEFAFPATRKNGFLYETDKQELMKYGKKIVRLCSDAREPNAALTRELQFARKQGFRMNYVPCPETFNELTWRLGLPWLSPFSTVGCELIQSTDCCNCQMFWYRLDHSSRTIALDLPRQQWHRFVERMLWEFSNPERPAALVDHVPMQHPVCWLTTLSELDEALSVWEPQGSTIIYIGQWLSRRVSSTADAEAWRKLMMRDRTRYEGHMA
jgi:siroheme synthase